jgi:hypothetical protein
MNSSFKNPTLIVGNDDDFGEVKMVNVLAGRRKVRDVFDVKRVKFEGER